MRFRQQLTSIDDQRSVIPHRQDTLRALVDRARLLERELYTLDRSRERSRDYGGHDDDDDDDDVLARRHDLQCSLDDAKEQVLLSSPSLLAARCIEINALLLYAGPVYTGMSAGMDSGFGFEEGGRSSKNGGAFNLNLRPELLRP